MFNEFDKNKDGLLTFEEIDHAFTRYCTNKGLQNFTQKNKLIQILDEIDTEKTGHISYEQFLRISYYSFKSNRQINYYSEKPRVFYLFFHQRSI